MREPLLAAERWIEPHFDGVPHTPLHAVRMARGRWPNEQDYRELKEELGLDHFEDRGWPGGIITSPTSRWPLRSFAPNSCALKKLHLRACR
jgi:hypothetical protein